MRNHNRNFKVQLCPVRAGTFTKLHNYRAALLLWTMVQNHDENHGTEPRRKPWYRTMTKTMVQNQDENHGTKP